MTQRHSSDPDENTELDLNGIDCRMFTGFNWLRIGSGNDLF